MVFLCVVKMQMVKLFDLKFYAGIFLSFESACRVAHQRHKASASIMWDLTMEQFVQKPPSPSHSSILLHCSLQRSLSAHLKQLMYALIAGARARGY